VDLEPDGGSREQAPSLEDRIQQALDHGDLDAAVALVEKHGSSQKGALFHLLAGDVFRRASRWPEAADAYLAAAVAGHGKKSERAYLRAVEIFLRKLDDPDRAAELVEAYLKRFPSGSHLDEALYLGGVVNSKRGDFERARALFESYLEKYPAGAQAVRVHLGLAKILVVKMSSCGAAVPHIQAVETKAPGTSMAAEARKLSARCAGKKTTVP
jgi:TolA-binding protein